MTICEVCGDVFELPARGPKPRHERCHECRERMNQLARHTPLQRAAHKAFLKLDLLRQAALEADEALLRKTGGYQHGVLQLKTI